MPAPRRRRHHRHRPGRPRRKSPRNQALRLPARRFLHPPPPPDRGQVLPKARPAPGTDDAPAAPPRLLPWLNAPPLIARPASATCRTSARPASFPPRPPARSKRRKRRTKIITRLVCQRLDAGLSQADVARRLGRTQSWVSKFEDRTDAELTLGDIQAYCQAIAGTLALEFGRDGRFAA
ncbi:MAG: hypothetical protein EBR70_05810 [Verrucomicrobia bacterium]|nr:hypothetical protein [Verrucomicrobiota bacterium]